MTNLFTYTIELREKMSHTLRRLGGSIVDNTKKVRSLRGEVDRLNKAPLNGLSKSFGGLFRTLAPAALLATALYKVNQLLGTSQANFKAQSVAEQRLATVMGNTMGARREDIKSILELASAQQKLGVVGDEVQLAGAQELATYLSRKSSLEKLMPVMNDMLAQQYGLSASQEQAVQIASMLGKVMDGQVGALSRYGYKFDAAQEKILKHGTEAQRVATLYDVVTSAVGGVNKALAQTPDGKEQQRINNLGDLTERLGGLIIMVKAAFEPVSNYLAGVADQVLSFFENNGDTIRAVVFGVAQLVVTAFNGIGSVLGWVRDGFMALAEGVQAGQPVFIAIAGIIAFVTGTLIAYQAIVGIITVVTNVWAAAQSLLNIIMTMNPLGLIIAAIIALIAIIVYVVSTTEGWGKTWQNVMDYMKLGFELFKATIVLIWLNIKNSFLDGFAVIEKGWYKLKSLWDKEGAQEGLARLQDERNARAADIAQQKGKMKEIAQQMASMKVWEVKSNGKGLGDVVNGLKDKLGIASPGVPGMNGVNGAGSDGSVAGGGSETGSAASSIATGGSKTTHITINLGNLVQSMTINSGDIREGAQKVRDIVLDELSRALTMAQANA